MAKKKQPIEAVISQEMYQQLAQVGKQVRETRAEEVELFLQEGKFVLDFRTICEDYNRSRNAILSYAKSHMGMTAGMFDKMCNVGQHMYGMINPKLFPYCDTGALLYIARLPEEEIPGPDGALRAYTEEVWSHMERRNGVYIRGKVIDRASYRWTEWHRDFDDRRRQQAEENEVQCRTGRIVDVNGVCSEDVTITFKVVGGVGKKPTAAKAKKLVKCLFKNGEIQFD